MPGSWVGALLRLSGRERGPLSSLWAGARQFFGWRHGIRTEPLSAQHEYDYCDICVNRSDDNMLDVCFQVSQRLTRHPTTTPQQCHKEIDNAANRADQ